MNRGMRRGALASFIIHGLLIAAAIIALPVPKLDQAQDTEVSVDLVGPSAAQEAHQPGKVAAPANTPTVNPANLAEKQPKPLPIVAPPPPPTATTARTPTKIHPTTASTRPAATAAGANPQRRPNPATPAAAAATKININRGAAQTAATPGPAAARTRAKPDAPAARHQKTPRPSAKAC